MQYPCGGRNAYRLLEIVLFIGPEFEINLQPLTVDQSLVERRRSR